MQKSKFQVSSSKRGEERRTAREWEAGDTGGELESGRRGRAGGAGREHKRERGEGG